ncbi:MAG: M56 family metallopeptidase [Aphanocapsa lilacina HA4352-LM1]|jgi:Zn-dependent protease with chaperone function|nr:M56 family metallopeptidase [Aphanocapsa lilacina HA4352-LM1]
MIHLALVLLAVLVGGGLRGRPRPGGGWCGRWNAALVQLLVPGLLFATTAATVLWMGTPGVASWRWDGVAAYWLSAAWWVYALAVGARHSWSCARTIRAARALPVASVAGHRARLLDEGTPYIALVGFWQPQLVFTSGLVASMGGAQLGAVLAHEQAHRHYRDTFWFFWLGWTHRATAFLPHSEALWQELLALRELRADRHAARSVDGLLLAEALVALAGAGRLPAATAFAAAVYSGGERLSERVEALIAPEDERQAQRRGVWRWLLVGVLPLLTWPLHGLAQHLCP